MAANTAPIYSKVGDYQWGSTAITTANTAKDGTGTVLTVFTADATNGGYAESISFCAAGTNVATVARIFLNNGSSNATPANNILKTEITLSATTLSEVSAQPPYIVPLNWIVPPGYKINVTIGTTVSAGYYVSVGAGKY